MLSTLFLMYARHRHRRSSLYGPDSSPRRGWLGRFLGLAVLLVAAWLCWKVFVAIFGLGTLSVQENATLSTEKRGIVNVTLKDEGDRTAIDGMTLSAGDTVSTGPTANANLRFEDGTWIRMDVRTTVEIDESAGGESGTLRLSVPQGQVWIATPSDGSGSLFASRNVTVGKLTYAIPANAQVFTGPQRVIVLAADGEGVTVSGAGTDPFFIGEGQQWEGPSSGAISGDPLSYRSAVLASRSLPTFVLESSNLTPGNTQAGTGATLPTTELLTITTPPAGYTLTDPTLKVRGTVSPAIAKVFVNGYESQIDAQKRTYSQEIAPPDGLNEFDVVIQGFDRSGAILADIRRTVKRQRVTATGPAAPTITSPTAPNGTFETAASEIVLRGTSPKEAVSVFVNDYKLQLFDPAKGTWSYLASTQLGNLKAGSNTYEVFVVDSEGRKSQPAKLIVVQGAAAPASSAPTSSKPTTLPSNDPLEPGTLSVTGPTAGLTHTETGTGFLLEGRTSAKTATVSVNGYSLQLYRAGKTTWNYIAAAGFGNLQKGTNTYKIVARDAQSRVLDTLTYTVTYEPR